MAEISASLVVKLREMTNAGMMDCKKALVETNGDLTAAVDLLRKRGVATPIDLNAFRGDAAALQRFAIPASGSTT